MANFAKINDSGIVEDVIAVDDAHEADGQKYINDVLGLDGRWIQTSFSGSFRKQFGGPGFTYDEEQDIFISPQPFPSWTLDENFDWIAPQEYPNDGKLYFWNNDSLSWATE